MAQFSRGGDSTSQALKKDLIFGSKKLLFFILVVISLLIFTYAGANGIILPSFIRKITVGYRPASVAEVSASITPTLTPAPNTEQGSASPQRQSSPNTVESFGVTHIPTPTQQVGSQSQQSLTNTVQGAISTVDETVDTTVDTTKTLTDDVVKPVIDEVLDLL